MTPRDRAARELALASADEVAALIIDRNEYQIPSMATLRLFAAAYRAARTPSYCSSCGTRDFHPSTCPTFRANSAEVGSL